MNYNHMYLLWVNWMISKLNVCVCVQLCYLYINCTDALITAGLNTVTTWPEEGAASLSSQVGLMVRKQ